ncbi:MAG: hypothetical protein ABSH30_09140 [Acidimicrobiales bacterium]
MTSVSSIEALLSFVSWSIVCWVGAGWGGRSPAARRPGGRVHPLAVGLTVLAAR